MFAVRHKTDTYNGQPIKFGMQMSNTIFRRNRFVEGIIYYEDINAKDNGMIYVCEPLDMSKLNFIPISESEDVGSDRVTMKFELPELKATTKHLVELGLHHNFLTRDELNLQPAKDVHALLEQTKEMLELFKAENIFLREQVADLQDMVKTGYSSNNNNRDILVVKGADSIEVLKK